MTAKTGELVREYGDQAYHAAARLAVIALNLGDKEGAAMFAACARELLESGYHKYPKSR